MDNKNYKYDFFISYKHGELDSEIASYLQQLLEQYKIPKDIQEKSQKKKISRVFRDESELSASSDLSKDIEEQLTNSEFLIVICSPDTKNSRWVDQEIRTFIKHRDRRNILPVLIKGEPEDSFPEVLMETEPMAADFRSTDKNLIKKRCRSELLRLVAPALYCSYDELKQRHKAYQFRRLAISASIIMVLAVLFSAYSIYQNVQIKKNYQAKLINQSKLMADKSGQLLEDGDREAALLVAMEALPESESDTNRPLVGEAMLALEEALGLYQLPDDESYYAHRILQMNNVGNLKYTLNEENQILATYDSENIIYFWDLESESLITTYTVSTDIYLLEVYIGNNTLAYICNSKEIVCFNYFNNTIEWTMDLSQEEGYYNSFALSPQNNILLCAGSLSDYSENSYSISWIFIDAATGTLISRNQSLTPAEMSCSIESLAWSPDNDTICIEYSYMADENSIIITNYSTGNSQVLGIFPQDDYATTVCSFIDEDTLVYLWGSNGSISLNVVYTATDYFVSAFNIDSMEKIWEVKTTASARDTYPQVQTSEIIDNSDQKKQLITVTAFSKVINIIDGQIVSETSYPNEIAGVFTNNRLQLQLTDDGILHKINALTGVAFNEFYGNSDLGVKDIMIARTYSDSEIFLLQQNSNNIFLLNQSYDDSGIILENSEEVNPSSFYNPSGDLILGVSHDYDNDIDTIYLWSNSDGKLLFTDTVNLSETELISSFDPGFIGQKYFYYATDERILLYSLETYEQLASFFIKDCEFTGGIIDKLDITNSDKPNMFLVSSRNDIIQLSGEQLEATYISSEDTLESLFDPEDTDEGYYSYQIFTSPNGRYLAINRYDFGNSADIFPIIIYDVEQQILLDIPSITLYPDTSLNNLVFSEDSNRLMVYNNEQQLQVIDLQTVTEIVSLDFAGTNYHQFWFSPDNQYLFLHANDKMLKIYDLEEKKYIMNSDDIIYKIVNWKFFEDGEYLLIQSETTLSYPFCALFYRTDTGTYEAFSSQSTCVDASLTHYIVDSDSTPSYIYKRPSLDEMLEMAEEYLNGRELTDLERQKYHIED